MRVLTHQLRPYWVRDGGDSPWGGVTGGEGSWQILVGLTSPMPCSPHRAITLENTLVILSTVAPDAGRYYVQAVNDKNGDNKTSQPITLTVASECPAPPAPPGCHPPLICSKSLRRLRFC